MHLPRIIPAAFICLALTCCSKKAAIPEEIEIVQPAEPSACFTLSSRFLNISDSVAFTNCSTNAETYDWNFGDGTTSKKSSPSHTFYSKGLFTVALSAAQGDKISKWNTTIACGMNAAIRLTYKFSDWNVPAEYNQKMGYTIVIKSFLYKSNDLTHSIMNFEDQYDRLRSEKAFELYVPLENEYTSYVVKVKLDGIYPISSNGPGDFYKQEDLGTMFSEEFRMFGTEVTTASQKLNLMTLSYTASETEFN